MQLTNNLLTAFSLSSLLATTTTAQSTAPPAAVPSYTPGNWTYDIPPEEASALAKIVEDLPPPEVVNATVKRAVDEEMPTKLRKRKDNLSPAYPLIYRNPLPIPPVKQPLK